MTTAAVTTIFELGIRLVEMARSLAKDLPDASQRKAAQALMDARMAVAMIEAQEWTPRPVRTGAPGVVSAETSTIAADPLTLVSDGVAEAIVTITLRDALGAPVPGKVVRLRAPGAPGTTQPVALTDAQGVARGGVSTTVKGPCTVSATGDGVTLRDTVSILFTAQ